VNKSSKRSKGLAYTSFAVLAASLIVTMVSLQVTGSNQIETGNADRIGETAFFLQSIFSDMDRSLRISTRRALTGTTNHIVLTGESLQNPKENISEALSNGTLDGEELNGTENASLQDWTSRVRDIADRSGYALDVNIRNYSFNDTGFTIQSSFSVFASLRDPTTLTTFNKTQSSSTNISIEDIEDPMLLLRSEGRYLTQYNKCGFSKPAEILYTGSQNSSGYVHGYVSKSPSDISAVADKPDKILAVENVDSYQTSEVNDFEGVISANPSSNTGQYSTSYVFDTDSIDDINQNMSLILNNHQIWSSRFRQMFEQECYVSDENGPDIFDRMENKLSNDDGDGLATLIDVNRLPSELRDIDSAVGYIYFDDSGSYGGLRKIKGVTDEYSWFRLDQDHIDEWGLDELAE
jgi:hypothetical protein